MLVGATAYCGMEEASISCLTYVGNQGSLIIDQFIAYF